MTFDALTTSRQWLLSILMLMLATTTQAAGISMGGKGSDKKDSDNESVQYYEGNVDGLRTYIDTLKYEEPDNYRILDKKVSRLETNETISSAIAWGSTIGGVALMFKGFAGSGSDGGDNDSGVGTMFSGIGLFLVGNLISGYFAPSRADMYDVINKHNSLRPDDPLKYSYNDRIQQSPGTFRIPQIALMSFRF